MLDRTVYLRGYYISSPTNCLVEELMEDCCKSKDKRKWKVLLQDIDGEFESVPHAYVVIFDE